MRLSGSTVTRDMVIQDHQSGWILLDPYVNDRYPSLTRLGQCFAVLKGFRQTGIYKFYVVSRLNSQSDSILLFAGWEPAPELC
jgi:hypothetical protein